jgi:hypothetical protein
VGKARGEDSGQWGERPSREWPGGLQFQILLYFYQQTWDIMFFT